MLGWHISIYRQLDDGSSPATFEKPVGRRLAVWQAKNNGLDWIDQLVGAGNAINLGGTGYPSRYTATVNSLLPVFNVGPQAAFDTWVSGSSDILAERWEGKTVIDRAAIESRLDEWLIVEAWDES